VQGSASDPDGDTCQDYLDVVVHIFTPEARDFYRLEQLWGDVPARRRAVAG
jgi:ribosomal silencing factor RsfS